MSKRRGPYAEAFRQQIVELALSGRSPAELSKEFGVSDQTVRNWIDRTQADNGKRRPGRDTLNSAERAELLELRRRVRRLQTERDILAKATAWFAGKSEKTSTPSTNS